MSLTLVPCGGNSRREYGVKFWVNGKPVTQPTPVKAGDQVSWRYLGGNVAAMSDKGAGWKRIRAMGADGRDGTIIVPAEEAE
jgi:hypothetical protein